MTTTFTEKEIESIKSTYQSELEKYNSLKKEISSLLEIPNLEKWNGKVLNKRFCSFLTENSDWRIETLKNFDVELACQSANEIIRIQTQNKIPSLYMETYEQNPLVGRLFAVMEVQY